jgi:bacterioferritin-associated ferredoxin
LASKLVARYAKHDELTRPRHIRKAARQGVIVQAELSQLNQTGNSVGSCTRDILNVLAGEVSVASSMAELLLAMKNIAIYSGEVGSAKASGSTTTVAS